MMSMIVKRTVAILAVLMLAGATVGCDREAGDEGIGVQEQEQEGMGLGDQEGAGLGEEAEPEEAREELAEGLEGDEGLQETRDDVADELEIPTDAVVFGPDIRQAITGAKSDFERTAWGTVGAVENHLTRINMDSLDEQERQAATQLQQQVAQTQQNLQQMGQATEQEAEQMEAQIEQELSEIAQNWEQISDKIQREDQPAGGGPLDGQQQMDDQEQENY